MEGWSLACRAPNPTIPVLGRWDVVRSSQTSFPERSLPQYGFLCRVDPREVSLSPSWQGVGAVPAVRATPPGGATEQGLRELDPLPLMRPDSEDGLGVVSGLGDLKNALALLCASVFICEPGPQRAREWVSDPCQLAILSGSGKGGLSPGQHPSLGLLLALLCAPQKCSHEHLHLLSHSLPHLTHTSCP